MTDNPLAEFLACVLVGVTVLDFAVYHRLCWVLRRETAKNAAAASIPVACFRLANKVAALIAARRQLRTTRYIADSLRAEQLEGEVEMLVADVRHLATRGLPAVAVLVAKDPGDVLTCREQSLLAVALLAVATFRDEFPHVLDDAAAIAAKLRLPAGSIDRAKTWLQVRAGKGGAA